MNNNLDMRGRMTKDARGSSDSALGREKIAITINESILRSLFSIASDYRSAGFNLSYKQKI